MQDFTDNIKLNEAEIESRRIALESRPRMLILVLTTLCNLECIMCSRVYPKRDFTIPFEAISQIRGLFPYLEGIDWQGGEVFLVDYFKQLFLEASVYQNINQSVITNGLLIDKEWARIFAQSKVNLTYSIDAVTKKTYEHIRKRAIFEDLLKSLELVNEYSNKYNNSIQLHINVVVMRSNYRELHLFPEFCRRYGVKHLRFDFMQPEVTPEEDILINPDVEAIAHLKSELKDIESSTRDSGIWFEYTFGPFLSDKKSDYPVSGDWPKNGGLKCKLPWKKLYIDAAGKGDVRPDCLCRRSIGNIIESSIDSIWNGSIMQSYRQRLAKEDVRGWCSQTCLSNAVDQYHMEGRC